MTTAQNTQRQCINLDPDQPAIKSIPTYDLNKIKFATDEATFQRAVDLYESGKVTEVKEALGDFSAAISVKRARFVNIGSLCRFGWEALNG